jgi:hypothetical protein
VSSSAATTKARAAAKKARAADHAFSAAAYATQVAHGEWLTTKLCDSVVGAAWLVRVAVLSSLRRVCDVIYAGDGGVDDAMTDAAPSVLTPPLLARVVAAVDTSLRDGKYAKVRVAAVNVFIALLQRARAASASAAAASSSSSSSAAALPLLLKEHTRRAAPLPTLLRGLVETEKDPGVLALIVDALDLVSD